MSRPIKWDEKKKKLAVKLIFQELLEQKSLRAVLDDPDKDKDKMPSRKVFKEWLSSDETLSAHYAHICEARADEIFDEILDICDDGTNDWMEKLGQDGAPVGWILNGEHVQRSRLRIQSRQWMLGKMNPKKYGERIQQDVTIQQDQPLFPDKAADE